MKHCSPHVSIVIVHWMNLRDTIECLESLRHLRYESYDVVLVNNASPDFNEAVVREHFPHLIVLHAELNLGFTGGNNLGIQTAMDRSSEFIMLLNPDTVVHPELLNTLVNAAEAESADIVGPVITFEPDHTRVWFAGGSYSSLIGFSFRDRPLAAFSGRRSTTWLNGCAFFVRRSVVEQIGLLWDGLYLYCEDLEYCLRAQQHGLKCLQIGESLVYHKVSSSSGKRGQDHLSPLKAYYFARNYLLVARRYAHGHERVTAILSQFTLLFAYQILGMLRSGSAIQAIRYYSRGLWHGLKGIEGPMPS